MNTGRKIVQQALHCAKWLAALVVVSMMLGPALPAAAEGSRTLYPTTQPSDASRANLEWNGPSNRYGPDNFNLFRRTLLRVYAQAGESILMGSSAVDVPDLQGAADQGDILVYDHLLDRTIGAEVLPDTPVFSCIQQRQQTNNQKQGRINSRAEELAGPATIVDPVTAAIGGEIPNAYTPCFYQAPATGVYYVVFYGPIGPAATATAPWPTGQIGNAPGNFNSVQSTTSAMWDVTVRASLTSTQDIPGRLYTYYLTMFTGGNGRPIYSTIYMVTTDGFRYQIDLNGMDPNGFIIYGNMEGFLDTDKTPLYHDVMAKLEQNGQPLSFEEQNQLRAIQGDVNLAPPEYLIFFNPPDEKVLQALGIPLQPIIPEVSNFKFVGPSGSGSITEPGKGGTFTFTSNVPGIFEIVLSRDGTNFNPDNPQNCVLRGIVDANGQGTVEWNGLDKSGQPFPEGGPYIARTTVHGGELHFPFLDVENSILGSPVVQLLNPPNGDCSVMAAGCNGAFYDDRGYLTANGVLVGTGVDQPLCPGNTGNPPNPLFAVNGYNTAALPNQRAFGFGTPAHPLPPSGGNPPNICADNGGFGDKKGLDLWTFYPSQPAETPLRIISSATAINLMSFTATSQQNGVAVRWQTSAEINTFGFRLYRSTDGTRSNAVLVTPELLPAQGRGQGGATYMWTDSTTQAGQRYFYWLQEVEASGATNEYGPATVITSTPASGSFLYLPLLN